MTKLTDDELITAVYNGLSRATDYSNASLSENRRQAWNYYLNRARGDEISGRSTVQDTSVRDTIHALLAQIAPAYAGDSIISFEPFGQNDSDAATAESSAVNNLFTETNKGFQQLYNAISDCLLFRNGTMKVHIQDKEETTIRSFAANPAFVMANAPDGQEWEQLETDDNGITSYQITSQTQTLVTEAIEQSYMFIDPNQSDQQLDDASFIGELAFFARSDLLEMGINRAIVDALPAQPDKSAASTGAGTNNTDLTAKYIDGVTDYLAAGTKDRDQIECYWIHIQVDRDGDGISERWKLLVSNRQLLSDEQVDFWPYSSGTGWPVPHRWSGLSVYDLLKITQNERTNARRQLADNLNVANNQRPVFDPGTTQAEDITTGAPGRGIRSTDPMSVHFMPVNDIVGNSISFLQYTDGIRSEATGAALDMQSADGQLLSTASGISAEMQLAPRELMAANVSRNIAETLVRNMFLLIHKSLRTGWNGPIMYNLAGDWQATNPAEWQPRTRLNVNVGLSPGERRRKSASLQQVMQIQMQMIQGGTANITTNWNGVHAAIQDWMASVELDGNEQYFLDPDGQESQAGQQAQAQQQQQQAEQAGQQQQMQQQMLQMQMQLEAKDRELVTQKQAADAANDKAELEFKYFDSLLDNETQQDANNIKARASSSADNSG